MIKLHTQADQPIYIDPLKIEGIQQRDTHTHVVTNRWDFAVKETADEVYALVKEATDITGTERKQAENWLGLHCGGKVVE